MRETSRKESQMIRADGGHSRKPAGSCFGGGLTAAVSRIKALIY